MEDGAEPRPRVAFDLTFNLGHLLTLTSFIVSIFAFALLFDYRLKAVESGLTKLSEMVIEAARFDERLKEISSRIERIEAAGRR